MGRKDTKKKNKKEEITASSSSVLGQKTFIYLFIYLFMP